LWFINLLGSKSYLSTYTSNQLAELLLKNTTRGWVSQTKGIDMNREVMVKALNVIKDSVVNTDFPLTNKLADAIYAIEKELAKPEQEPRKEWVGLTDEDTANICMQGDLNDWHDEQVIDATEAKLKEKNS
jgi:hypothetical protein